MSVRDHSKFIEKSQELSDELGRDTERELVESLADIRDIRDAMSQTRRTLSEAELPVKQWLEFHDELVDGEKGLRAYLTESRGFNYEKLAVIQEADPSLYRRLEALGCFEINPEAITTALQKGWLTVGDIERWRFAKVTATVLHVDRTKK